MTRITAEVGQNHEGSIDRAEYLAKLAVDNGADSVKFQLMIKDFDSSAMMTKFINDKKRGLMTIGDWEKLNIRLKLLGIDVYYTVFDIYSMHFVGSMLKPSKFKIASCSNRDLMLIERCSNYDDKIKTYISTGMGIDNDAIVALSGIVKPDTVFYHCVSEYPCINPNIDRIDELRNLIPNQIGYSDHTIGVESAITAIKHYNISDLEVHFTDDHNFSDFRDHQLSKTPDQLKKIALARG